MVRIHLDFSEWATVSCAKVTSRVFAALEWTNSRLRYARDAIVDLGHRAKAGHLRLQQALREKETGLAKLLADSAEPVVVIDNERRLLAANAAGLALLGVSDRNIRNFTIDAFVTPNQVHCFEHRGPPFVKGAAQLGECEIRSLGGKAKAVSVTFQTNFMLGRHLITFQYAVPRGTKSLERTARGGEVTANRREVA